MIPELSSKRSRMDSPMHPVDTSTCLGQWGMSKLTYQQTYQEQALLLGFSAMYQQGINRLESLKPCTPLEES